MGGFYEVLLLLMVLSAVFTDLAGGRIPNPLIAAGSMIALIRVLAVGGSAAEMLCGAIIPILLLFPLFCLRMFGAGDLKLLAMAGGFFGVRGSLRCLFWSLIFGGLLGLVQIVDLKNGRERLICLIRYLQCAFEGDYTQVQPYLTYVPDDGRICFSVPVLLAVVFLMGAYK